ncbi:sigma-70 family RNA polymerase sigma factor [Plantactinospora soyae]|uniref:RNA polymerase sigma factor (Sigma-70 family) n=1 Tax=Plantactinospora soyae TaxID=1544732 RepID=A0A927M7T4_9ACTN|nr:sigma-70 family RNA polymerase sigma factor [Plantactinospora soyae]MBE1489364.1 RNA polymerase sigma factor (sigma-70 family) [Plantactinospora soyae]
MTITDGEGVNVRTAVDPALVIAARGGDEQAMATLVAEAMPLVYNVVGKALHGSSDVDDVVQETMLRVVRGIAGLKDPDRFRAWVISIAYRQMQDRGRSIRVATALGPLVGDVSQWPDPAGDFVDSTMFRLHLSGERRETYEASRWLSVEDQRVLRLWWQESAGLLTRADLATGLGLTPAHAAVRVQRVKAQLALARTLLRAWHAIPRCAELTEAAQKLSGPSDPRWLKRLGRHVRRCEVCLAHERELIPAEHLIAGANLAPVLAGLAGAAATAGGVAAPVWGLWDPLQRAARYLMAKFLPVGGLVAVGTAGAFVLAVHYPAYQDGGPELAEPSVAATAEAPSAAPTAGPGSTPAPAPRPAGGVNGVTTASYYVAPDGSDTNPGSLDLPFATLDRATSVVRPGQNIALRGGVYRPTRPVEITTSGTADRRIVLSNYRNEIPTIDASQIPADAPYVSQRASYWTVQGLQVHGAPGSAYVCRSCAYSVFRGLSFHDNGQTGLLLRDPNTTGNLVVDSDFFRNHDTATNGEYADGLGIEYGSGTGNVVRNCRLYENADDGLGLHEFTGPVTIERTWSFGNGVNRWGIAPFDGDGYGFKLGGGTRPASVDHVVTGSAAWDNAGYGFTESGNAGTLTVRSNTAFRNGKTGFAFERSTSLLRQNLSIGNAREWQLGAGVDAADNSWNQDGWSGAELHTTDPGSTLAPRPPGGGLPPTTFLTNTRDDRIGAAMGR